MLWCIDYLYGRLFPGNTPDTSAILAAAQKPLENGLRVQESTAKTAPFLAGADAAHPLSPAGFERARLLLLAIARGPGSGEPFMEEALLCDRHCTFVGATQFFWSADLRGIGRRPVRMVRHLCFTRAFLEEHAGGLEPLRACMEAVYACFCTLMLGFQYPLPTVELEDGGRILPKAGGRPAVHTLLWQVCARWFLDLPLTEPAGRHVRVLPAGSTNRVDPGTLWCWRNRLVQVLSEGEEGCRVALLGPGGGGSADVPAAGLRPLDDHGKVWYSRGLQRGACPGFVVPEIAMAVS